MGVSQRDRAYNYIRTQLISGHLPPGSRLSHRALAKEIGTSFIPVREAVSQLVSEGLLGHEPKMGSFVMQVSRQELAELYDLREALESHGVMVAAGAISQSELDDMQQKNDVLSEIAEEVAEKGLKAWSGKRIDRWMLNDAEFHVILLRAAGNRRALRIVSDLRLMTHVFGHHNAERALDDLQRVTKEHQQLLNALRKGNAEKAREVLVSHLRMGCERALRAYDRGRLEGDDRQQSGLTYPEALREQIHALERDAEPAPSGRRKKRAPTKKKKKKRPKTGG